MTEQELLEDFMESGVQICGLIQQYPDGTVSIGNFGELPESVVRQLYEAVLPYVNQGCSVRGKIEDLELQEIF